MKDVQAEIMAIGAGLKSRTKAISERGYDAEQVDAETAADRERADGLELTFGQMAAPQQKEAAVEAAGNGITSVAVRLDGIATAAA